jgi:hypothetical protein
MKRHSLLFSVTLLASLVLLDAHGPTDGIEHWGIDAEKLEPAPARQGYRDLSRELLRSGSYRFKADQIGLLQKSHQLFLESAVASSEDPDQPAKVRTAAEILLQRLLDGTDWTIDVPIGPDGPSVDGETVHFLPREGGILLLHVHGDAPGPGAAFVVEKNLETHKEHHDPLIVPFQANAENWILLRLLSPPLEESIVQFTLRDVADGGREFPLYLRVVSEVGGFLDFTVRDENGEPCPVMVELKSSKTGRIYRPSGAVEFSEQMDHIAGTPVPSPDRPDAGQGVPYMASIQGPSFGFYYCVAGPFSMAIPAGDWSLKIWRGVEYVPVQTVINVAKGEETTVDIQLDRWINLPEQGWHAGDDHIHSRLMSDQDADRLLTFMEATDLSMGNVLLMGNYLRTFYPQRGFGPEFRVERDGRFLVPGQEDPRYLNGHSLGLNITALVRDEDKYLFTDWVAREVEAQGGLYGFAHLVGSSFNIIRDLSLLLPQDLGSFGEIHQSGLLDTELYYEFLNLGFELAASGGSDVPYSHMMGELRVYCYTGDSQLDPDAWFDALREGQTFVTNGPIVDLIVNGQRPGARITVKDGDFIEVSASAKGPAGGGAPDRLELLWLGEVVASASSTDLQKQELRLETRLPAGFGGWLALRATSHDGQTVHSSPVYLTREGFRHWNPDAVPAVIDKIRSALESYRQELIHMAHLAETGQYQPGQPYVPQLAKMVPDGIQRIDTALAFYNQLLQQLQDEKLARLRASD